MSGRRAPAPAAGDKAAEYEALLAELAELQRRMRELASFVERQRRPRIVRRVAP